MKKFVFPLLTVLIFAASACVASAQCYPTYSQHCAKTYSNSNVGTYMFGDKLVRPFDTSMSTCCNAMSGFNIGHCERGCLGKGCANGCSLGHGCFLGGLFGRGNVPCAGPDKGYVYTPGFGANGQGLRPNFGLGGFGQGGFGQGGFGQGGFGQGGFGQGSYGQGQEGGPMPSYTYRSPRDFLNPNPPSIGY